MLGEEILLCHFNPGAATAPVGPVGHPFDCDADVSWLTCAFSITLAELVNAVGGGIAYVKRLQLVEQISFCVACVGGKNRGGRRTTMKR
jgi:hypothetical protein